MQKPQLLAVEFLVLGGRQGTSWRDEPGASQKNIQLVDLSFWPPLDVH
ncbi:hypothetical protein [Acaryochloris sp. IP29b_bin.137]|nr:hypothetical protein [Acaryochloris sp. IP29b_bin.137]